MLNLNDLKVSPAVWEYTECTTLNFIRLALSALFSVQSLALAPDGTIFMKVRLVDLKF